MNPRFGSKLLDYIMAMPEKAPASEFERIIQGGLRKGAFKPEELEWSGGPLMELLKDEGSRSKRLTKAQLKEKFHEGEVKVEERVFGGRSSIRWEGEGANRRGYEEAPDPTRWSSHTLPGGQNYRELVMTLPSMKGSDEAFMMGGREVGRTSTPSFTHSHWEGVENPLLHIRFDERVAPDGKRTLFVHELQSDWHQQGKREGYKGPDQWKVFNAKTGEVYRVVDSEKEALRLYNATRDADDSHFLDYMRVDKSDLVPDAPFKKSWLHLGMKRLLSWAKENGFERIAWPGTGEQIAAIEGKTSPQLERHYFDTMTNTMNELMKPHKGRVETSNIDKIPYRTPTEQAAWDDIVQATEGAEAQGIKTKRIGKSTQSVYSIDLPPTTPSKWPLFAAPPLVAGAGGLMEALGPSEAEAGMLPPEALRKIKQILKHTDDVTVKEHGMITEGEKLASENRTADLIGRALDQEGFTQQQKDAALKWITGGGAAGVGLASVLVPEAEAVSPNVIKRFLQARGIESNAADELINAIPSDWLVGIQKMSGTGSKMTTSVPELEAYRSGLKAEYFMRNQNMPVSKLGDNIWDTNALITSHAPENASFVKFSEADTVMHEILHHVFDRLPQKMQDEIEALVLPLKDDVISMHGGLNTPVAQTPYVLSQEAFAATMEDRLPYSQSARVDTPDSKEALKRVQDAMNAKFGKTFDDLVAGKIKLADIQEKTGPGTMGIRTPIGLPPREVTSPEIGMVSQPDIDVGLMKSPQGIVDRSGYAVVGGGLAGGAHVAIPGDNGLIDTGEVVEMDLDDTGEIVEMIPEEAERANATGGYVRETPYHAPTFLDPLVNPLLEKYGPPAARFLEKTKPYWGQTAGLLSAVPTVVGQSLINVGSVLPTSVAKNISGLHGGGMIEDVPEKLPPMTADPLVKLYETLMPGYDKPFPDEVLMETAGMPPGMQFGLSALLSGFGAGGMTKAGAKALERRGMTGGQLLKGFEKNLAFEGLRGSMGGSPDDIALQALNFHSDMKKHIPLVLEEKLDRMVKDGFFSNQDLIDSAQEVFKKVPLEKRPPVLQMKGDKLEVNVNIKELVSQMSENQVQQMMTGALLGKTGPRGVVFRRTPAMDSVFYDYARDVEKIALNFEPRYGTHSMVFKPMEEASGQAKLARVAYAGHLHERLTQEMGKLPNPMEQDNVGNWLIARRQTQAGRPVTVTPPAQLTQREQQLVEIIDDELNLLWDTREMIREALGLPKIEKGTDYFMFVNGGRVTDLADWEKIPGELHPFYTHEVKEMATPAVTNPLEALMIRAGSQFNEMYMNPVMRQAKQRINTLPPEAADLRNYMRHFMQRMANIPSRADTKMSWLLNKPLGSQLSNEDVATVSRKMVDLGYASTMWFRPWTALRNLMQPVLTTAPEFGNFWTARGTARTMTDSTVGPWLKKMGYMEEFVVPEIYTTMEHELAKRGLDKKATQAGMAMFTSADKATRAITAVTANDKFDWAVRASKGDMKKFEAKSGLRALDTGVRDQVVTFIKEGDIEAAKDAYIREGLRKTQFLYTKEHSPLASQALGGQGRLWGQYRTWVADYADMYADFWTKGTVGDRSRKIATHTFNSVLLYGVLTEGAGMDPKQAALSVGLGPFVGMGPGVMMLPVLAQPVYNFAKGLLTPMTEGVDDSSMSKMGKAMNAALRGLWSAVPGGYEIKDIKTGFGDLPEVFDMPFEDSLSYALGFRSKENAARVKQMRQMEGP